LTAICAQASTYAVDFFYNYTVATDLPKQMTGAQLTAVLVTLPEKSTSLLLKYRLA
jgi:hypothetical protein